ncbi:MAG: helix-turn-helix domain-containing protein [Rhizobiales bacterium]|nr:helix-turn-helix domain-containing protein [Hyphomicrobiales bacterium]
MNKMGQRLMAAAKEARAFARGEADASTYRVHVPANVNVQKIRRKLDLSQAEFAARFGIKPGTLRDWEQKRKTPEGPARVLLMVIDREPEAVQRALEPA